MSTRSRTSFQKRQKEIARAEKQRSKQAKRQQKKLEGDTSPDLETESDVEGEPLVEQESTTAPAE